MVVYQPVERFLSVLVLDGVLERYPGAAGRRHRDGRRLGAGDAAPPRPRRRDLAAAPSPASPTFARRPSEQAAAQLRFTPYPFEDVGRLCRESDPSLYLFSSDYPHAEGGRDPLGRFERSLADLPDPVHASFLCGSAGEWLGLRRGGPVVTPPGVADAGRDSVSSAHSEEVRP